MDGIDGLAGGEAAVASSFFFLDTTFTLFRRLIRREKWYQAHRSHFYQREPQNRDVDGNRRTPAGQGQT
jgi:hypothetical protein